MGRFRDLARDVQRAGWMTAKLPLAELRALAAAEGCGEVANRRGAPTVATLRPSTRQDARPQSLSAIVGLDRQPMHTDGAHHETPPDILVLSSATPNDTPTLLWRLPNEWAHTPAISPDALAHGMFLVHGGGDSFFAAALTNRQLRYDPGCMTPCDARSSAVAAYFASAADGAEPHHWTSPDEVLLIDNRRALHARAAVAGDDVVGRELSRLALRLPETA